MKRFALPVAILMLTGTTYLLGQQAGAPPGPPPPPRGEQGGPGQQGREQGRGQQGRGQQGQGQQGPGQGRPRSPLMEALDTDKNGTLSADEIKNSAASLAKLDKNGDGQLTQDEIRPPRPEGNNGPGGNGGPGRPQGGPGQGRGPGNGQGQGQGQGRPQAAAPAANDPPLAADQRALVFSGGAETDPRDRGRPVVLIAGALGVTSDVFRDAFSRVRPAGAGQEPDPEQVRQNKANLMMALGKHGVTNERLDEVSNYYRYVQSRGETWPMTPAKGYAKLKDGKVTGIVVTSGGSGYSSTPTVSVEGMPDVATQVKLSYGPEFAKNGSVTSVTAAP